MGNDLKIYSKRSLSTQTREYGYIQEYAVTGDGRGGVSKSWVNAHPQPHAMAILPLSAIQVMNFDSINVEATHLIKIRGEIDILEVNRISANGIFYEVLTVRDIQDRGIVKWVIVKERRE